MDTRGDRLGIPLLITFDCLNMHRMSPLNSRLIPTLIHKPSLTLKAREDQKRLLLQLLDLPFKSLNIGLKLKVFFNGFLDLTDVM